MPFTLNGAPCCNCISKSKPHVQRCNVPLKSIPAGTSAGSCEHSSDGYSGVLLGCIAHAQTQRVEIHDPNHPLADICVSICLQPQGPSSNHSWFEMDILVPCLFTEAASPLEGRSPAGMTDERFSPCQGDWRGYDDPPFK